ncbi:MFS transporter [Acuticoccus sp. MNP-M23]|uniref:MFS transporter n=1 Tax=Acuticoccus sp. MNP-M23 TaxID=3072793 RepID=UPI0028163B46|nr:MFS transporter [Acuticoccus sp. MNP-M23]WMS41923.1 MFS transporter [Acuticoccus sp. MNP-M23]
MPATVRLPLLLAETTAVQAVGSAAVLAIAAVAPAVALSVGVPASLIGTQIAIVYLGGIVSSIFAGMLVGSVGPCRTSQISMVLNAFGALLCALPAVLPIVAGSLVIGLAYGLINPAASTLLAQHAPPRRRNIVFSIKQTGVPIGAAMVGLAGPSMALALGWGSLLVAIALISLGLAAALEPGRKTLDTDAPRSTLSAGAALRGLLGILRNGPLACLALASFCFSAIQLCTISFLVVMLVQDYGFGLVAAGGILAIVQGAGIAGRLFWGGVADVVGAGARVLAGLALLMACAAGTIVAAGLFGWPTAVVIAALIVLGFTGIGWNGVYLSEVARFAPMGDVSAITGAAMVFTFAGVLVGPNVFGALHALFGTFAEAFITLVIAAGVAFALMMTILARGTPKAATSR